MKKINFWIYVVIRLVLVEPCLQGNLDHICIETNVSAKKFRTKMVGRSVKKAIEYCVAHNILERGKPHFDWPVDLCDFWVSSLPGARTHGGVTKMHKGVDLAAMQGSAVKSAAPGKVIKAEHGRFGYGNVVDILHKGGMVTRYGHLDEILVTKGQKVDRGEMVGTVGSTGNTRGTKDPSHLHFEIIDKHGKNVDPLLYIYCGEVA